MTTFIQLLGTAKANLESHSVPFLADKRFLLLAFLAFKHDWVSREQLANLFWGDTDSVSARKNLRHLLSRVRGLGFAELEGQDDVRWLVDTDVALFLQCLGAGDWEGAIAAYHGNLLAGLTSDSSDFEDWLRQESEALQGAYREAALNYTKHLELEKRFEAASVLLAKVLKADLLAEDIVQAYLRVASNGKHRVDALRAFEAFKTLLRQELGLEPLEITKQLAEALKQEASEQKTSSPQPQHPIPAPDSSASILTDVLTEPAPKLRNLPTQTSSFVGRDVDLSEIVGFFKEPNIRLLTLIGSGGMGKTRLAMQVAIEQVKHFPDGVTFVPLASIGSTDDIVPTIASALDLSFTNSDSPDEQLKAFLHDQDMLLILDNLEHVISGAGIILELLEHCPKLKILTTSREALDFYGEYLVDVTGMDVPKDENTEHIEVYDSVQLFLRSARRVNPRFAIDTTAKPFVARICQLLQGSPLAIELATNWLRLLSVQEVAEEIQKSLDFLKVNQPDLPERHRSMRAVFEHSWNLLTEDEQSALKRLSVFRGGFRKEAAEDVCGVTLRSLLTLTNKSLLQRTPSGRFERHVMVREFAEEKLAQDKDIYQAQQTQHGMYYFDFLEQRTMGTSKDQQYLKEIEEDLENIRTAWDWAVRNARADQLGRSADLVVFYDRKARCEEGARLFQAAIEVLDAGKVSEQAALGKACFDAAWLGQRLGRYEQAHQLATRAVELLRPLEDQVGIWLMKALSTLSAIEEVTGNNENALQNLQEALVFARKQEDQSAIANYLDGIGCIELRLGYVLKAEAHFREALEIHENLNNNFGSVIQCNNLGLLKSDLNEFEEAKQYLQDGLRLAQKINFAVIIPYLLNNIAALAYRMKDYKSARVSCLDVLHELETQNNLTVKATALMTLGRISTVTNSYFESKMYFYQSLEIVWHSQELPIVLQNLIGLAELNLKLGNINLAREFLQIAVHHPSTKLVSRLEAQTLYEQLPQSDKFSKAPAKDTTLTLKNIVTDFFENTFSL
jgi:predicted ATPase/DNA-binding SARP family transcriptional activator